MPASLRQKLQSRGAAIQSTQEMPVRVPYGGWMPDQPELGNPGANIARNVIPGELDGSYEPARDLVKVSTNAIESEALGGVVARDKDNNIFPYVGTTSKLYELRSNAWSDESKAGGYTTGVEDVWEFAVWDRDQKVIATNFADPVQSIDIGGGASSDFADLITSTNKPKAKHVDVVRDFLVLGHTDDATDGVKPNRVWWSGIGSVADFDPDAATQSDYSDLATGGWVQRVVGGAEYGVVFQENLIRRMEYQGTPVIFDIPAADRRRGTPIPNSVISFGRNIFYISEEGFFVFNGSSSEPIGNGRVDNEFWRIFDLADKTKVSVSIDLIKKLVCWGFPVASAVPNTIFCYKWDGGGSWSEIRDLEFDRVGSGQNQGYTLDGLDVVSTNIDTLTPSLDSDVWKGGKRYSGAFTSDHFLASFDGNTLEAIIQTAERQLTMGRNTYVSNVRPLVEINPARTTAVGSDQGAALQVAISSRDRVDVNTVTDGPVTVNVTGEASFDNEARYQRFTVRIPAAFEWRNSQGLIAYKHAMGRYDGYSVS